jgi:Short-chain dehydrogenases of various substrate specificities
VSTPVVLVTGASGYIGRKFVRALAAEPGMRGRIVAMDVREDPTAARQEGVEYVVADVRDAETLTRLMADHGVETVVHLASIVTPGRDATRDLAYAVDVQGTRNVLDACLRTGVGHLIVTSSGAAYGYHADGPEWLDEDDALRGNAAFAYAHHKRLVEEMLAEARAAHPALRQLVFRPGTVLGEGVHNQITALFEKPFVLGIAGSASPFVFILDEDVAACLVKGVVERRTGVFNLAGDGTVSLREIARRTGNPFVPLPPRLVAGALRLLHPLGLSRYNAEQVDFLRYRPVLSNRRLKEVFGYTPRLTSSQVFDHYWRSRGGGAASGGNAADGPRAGSAGPVVVLTGAAGGIGSAIAHRYARDGASVALLDVDEKGLNALERALAGSGATVLALPCDITDPHACRAAVDRVVDDFGGVDVLVNNAGMTHLSFVDETDASVFRRVMDVNFFGAVHVTQAALPSLIERRGAIVVLSSVAGFAPLAGRSVYAASKHALHGFFGSLRGELRDQGVGVTLICPSFVRTRIGDRALGADGGAAVQPRTETGRPIEPGEVAEAVLRAARKRRRTVVLSREGKLAWALWMFAPALYERIMIRRLVRGQAAGRGHG